MTIWQKILYALGLIDQEYHHIIDGFHTAIANLHNLADRETDKAAKLTAEISAKAIEQTAAVNNAHQAFTTAAGIKKMLAGG